MKTEVIVSDIGFAAGLIKQGELVAVPTETVYGLASNGLDPEAVEKIYIVKGRPETKPINLLVSGMEDVEKLCSDIPKEAYTLAEKFWPGPLTMILLKKPKVPDIVTAGGATVGVRCPDSEKTLKLIKLSGVPLATPSANPSGQPSPKTFEKVMEYFDGSIAGAIDGGECAVGVESTIVDMTSFPPKILRQGGLSREKLCDALGVELG